MDNQIKSLRQQVAAAEFLLNSLRVQLKDAEARAAQQSLLDIAGTTQRDSGAPLHISQTAAANRAGSTAGNVVGSGLSPFFHDHALSRTLDDAGGGGDVGLGDIVVDDHNTTALPSLEIGTLYPTLEDIKKAAISHAISQGWTCGVHKRDKMRLILRCRSGTSCPFHLRAEQLDFNARVAAYKPDHTCTFQPDQSHVPRGHATKLDFMREQLPSFMNVDASTTAQEISDAIFERFGTRVSLKQCRELRVAPKRKRKVTTGTCKTCGAVGHNRKTCGRITEPSP